MLRNKRADASSKNMLNTIMYSGGLLQVKLSDHTAIISQGIKQQHPNKLMPATHNMNISWGHFICFKRYTAVIRELAHVPIEAAIVRYTKTAMQFAGLYSKLSNRPTTVATSSLVVLFEVIPKGFDYCSITALGDKLYVKLYEMVFPRGFLFSLFVWKFWNRMNVMIVIEGKYKATYILLWGWEKIIAKVLCMYN